jgi:DNA processing protein
MIGVTGASRPPTAREGTGREGTGRATERECWIALSQVPGIGPAGFYRLLRRYGTATDAWAAGPTAIDDVRRPGEAARGDRPRERGMGDARAVARAVQAATERAGGRVLIALDDDYPPALQQLDPRPPTLFVVGEGAAFEHRAIAIVGTRRASGYGLSIATELSEELARTGVVVVSGLALGIDGAAHRAATTVGGTSIAVLPSPIDRVYPPRHRSLAREILRTGGALVSEIAIGAPIGRPDFARRNRIIAGLAEAVVVVEAPDRSGALLTAAAATAIGRELYAVPGPIDAMSSRGCNRLIADHQATIVTSPAALLRQVGLRIGSRPPAVEHLSEVEGQVLRRLLEHSGSLEELIDRSGHSAAAVASALTLLEVRGLVDSFGGATFHATPGARRLAHDV